MAEVLITTHLVKEFDLGMNGNLYGGRLLDWLDEAGALFVHDTFKGNVFVTWKVGETVFHKTVKQKAIVKLYIQNVDVRTHSVGFEISARVEQEEVLSTSMVFVCVDAVTGQKKAIRKS